MEDNQRPLSLFIIDDHQLAREAIKSLLGDAMQVIGEAGSAAEVLTILAGPNAPCPDLFLLDLSLPDIHGLILFQTLHRMCPASRIVILTAHKHPTFRLRCLRAGAAGYLTKDQSRDTMRHTLHQAMTLNPVYNRRLTYRPLPTDDSASLLEAKLADLSDVELHLLIAIAKGGQTPVLYKQFGMSAKQVREQHVNLLQKMCCKNDLQLAKAAVELGLVDPQDVRVQKTKAGHITRFGDR